jgi:hypothetical protein
VLADEGDAGLEATFKLDALYGGYLACVGLGDTRVWTRWQNDRRGVHISNIKDCVANTFITNV